MATLKNHHIKFKTGPADCEVDEWESLIRQVGGVTKVTVNLAEKDVYIEYELEKCCEEAIERWMLKSGFVLDDSLLERMKRGIIHFTEENAQENLRSKAHSCCEVDETKIKNKDDK